jgi:threonyl-tRNA synthetase
LGITLDVYRVFGFDAITIKLALRPDMRLGDDATWDRAEVALRDALRACGVEWTELPGEGAFYGPKIEYHLKDSIGRSWQCGTMQVDFQMPGRLGAEYVDEDNGRKTPVMLHRAIVGSLERFIGILIEHHAGALPLWLSPLQAVVLTITDRQAAYAREVEARLKADGFRVAADLRNEKITYKIREHSLQKLPYQLIVGDKEVQARQVAVRTRGGEDLGAMPVDALLARLREEVAARR